MKKSIAFVACAFFIHCGVQSQTFDVEDNVINVGIGLGSSLGSGDSSSESPAISVSYERGVWEAGDSGVIGIGGYLGYKSYKISDSFKFSYTVIGARGAYHYHGWDIEDLDLYAGVMLSYNIFGGDEFFGFRSSYFGFSGFLGGRYFFNDNIGAMLEVGFGVSNLNLGVAFKI